MPGEFRPSLPGERRGGRQKGTLNKVDQSIKDMIVGALCAVGGVEYLARQAEQNPVAFMGLVGRAMPLQLAGHDGGKLEVEFRWRDAEPHTTINCVVTDVATEQAVAYECIPDQNAADTDVDTPQITFIGEC